MGKIIMIGAMKGGVGKTVTAFNLAYSLQKCGRKVLAVDFDPQSNLTTCFGVEDADMTVGDLMMNVIGDEDLPDEGEYIQERKGVDFIPSSMQLSAVDAKLRPEMGAERMLAAILEPLREEYNYILIDICPSLGALNINAMAAADEVILTVNPQLLAMMGLQGRIPNTVKVGESVYYSEPLIEYAPESNVCRAYEELAREVAANEG